MLRRRPRLPASTGATGQRRSDRRACARARLDLDGAAEQPHTLGDPGEPEALAVEATRVEAVPVVGHREADERACAANGHRDSRRAAVLAHIRQRLLHDAEEHDLLGVAEARELSVNLELCLDAGCVLKCAKLDLDRLRDRAGDRRARPDRVRDLAQALVERAEPGVNVVEAAEHALPVLVGDDRRDLHGGGPQLFGERDDLLQGAVVQIEAESHQAPLPGCDELVLALHPPVEEGDALEDGREGDGCLREIVLQMLGVGAAAADHERGVRPIPPLDHASAYLRRAENHAVEGGPCDLPDPTAARGLAV